MYSRVDYQLAYEYHRDAVARANNYRLIQPNEGPSVQQIIFTWIASIPLTLKRVLTYLQERERTLRSAAIVERAADTFVRMHPEMVQECFDTHFFTQRANVFLAEVIAGTSPYSATDLAGLWAAQFGVNKSAHARLTKAARHMAAEFLYVLELTVKNSEQQGGQPSSNLQGSSLQRNGLQSAHFAA